jgi:acyl carrier protein
MQLTPDNWGANSHDLVEVVMTLEEAFDTEIPDEEMEKIRGFRNVEKCSTTCGSARKAAIKFDS